jgi:hypothetical protein
MSAKDMLIDFINLVFAIVLVGAAIIYFTTGDHFENFKRLIEALVPFVFLIMIFMVNLKFWRQRARKRESEGNMGVVLEMTYADKLKSDLFLFALPISVLFISFLSEKRIGVTAVMEAAVVLAIAYFWQKWFFSKETL